MCLLRSRSISSVRRSTPSIRASPPPTGRPAATAGSMPWTASSSSISRARPTACPRSTSNRRAPIRAAAAMWWAMALNRRTPFPLPLATTLPLADRDPERFELKYWVPEPALAEIREFVRPYLIIDPFISRLGLTSEYNTSLYFETPELACYRNHIDSAADRFKLRIRVYGNPPTSPAFFELKRKIKNVTVKTRTKVPRSRV